MSDFSSWILPAVKGGPAGKATSSSVVTGNRSWDGAGAGGMDQIRVVRIDDTHIASEEEEQSHVGGKVKGAAECYEVEEVIGEEDEDGVYVIEYSNPEEEGASYQFTMAVDRSVPAKRPKLKHPAMRENARAPLPVMSKLNRPPRPRINEKQRRKPMGVEEVKREAVVSNKHVLELGEDYSYVMATNSNSGKELMCKLCPPPGRFFKRAAGLAVHLKHMHFLEANKTFFCTTCQQSVRTQIELDAHTKRHANQGAVFTCLLCSAETENKAEKPGYRGSKLGLKKHLQKEHPGVVPRCNVCNKGFASLSSYLADQFRHVGVSPYYCALCQIYEMTERGLSVHNKNHDKRKKKQQLLQESAGIQLPTLGVPANAAKASNAANAATDDNSATDDSDF
ncbi:zinc finger protein 382 isoform X1 [Sebastes umbrosus]|uniref:zinc finger protein 382 isoform X1 n=2 Tax=Sebastes umbrosus TaxID=72105 RepID=UPI00189C5A7A|nr:zinc finger protein 382 isoform X1 [Sebastes umbrosus]